MNEEQFERAKEIDWELKKLDSFEKELSNSKPDKDLGIDIKPAWARYQVEVLKVIQEKRDELKAELARI